MSCMYGDPIFSSREHFMGYTALHVRSIPPTKITCVNGFLRQYRHKVITINPLYLHDNRNYQATVIEGASSV